MKRTRVRVVAIIAATLTLGSASPAEAHTLTGVAPTDYRSRIAGVRPGLPRVTARLLDLGRRIEVQNHSATDVTVLGYDGEPYLKVGPQGAYANVRSPTYVANQIANTPTTVPRRVSPSTQPKWRRVSAKPVVRWRDRRTRWEGSPPEAVRLDRGHRHLVGDWSIPLVVAPGTSASAAVQGSITWVPPPPVWPFFALAAWLALAVAALTRLRRWGLPLAVATAFLVVADVVHTTGQVAFARGGALLFVARLVLGAVFSVAAWLTLVFAIRPLARAGEGAAFAAGIGGFFIAVLTGAGDSNAIFHSQVPSVLAPELVRILVAVCLGLGVGIAVAATVLLRRTQWWSRATSGQT